MEDGLTVESDDVDDVVCEMVVGRLGRAEFDADEGDGDEVDDNDADDDRAKVDEETWA